jgi:hypothetical protein
MNNSSFGSAQIAFGKTCTVDAKSLVSIVEHEDKPNTIEIMLPSESKGMIHIVDLRGVKE